MDSVPLAQTLVVIRTLCFPSRNRWMISARCSTVSSPLKRDTWCPSFDSCRASHLAFLRVYYMNRGKKRQAQDYRHYMLRHPAYATVVKILTHWPSATCSSHTETPDSCSSHTVMLDSHSSHTATLDSHSFYTAAPDSHAS